MLWCTGGCARDEKVVISGIGKFLLFNVYKKLRSIYT